jgi:hypothetical protein
MAGSMLSDLISGYFTVNRRRKSKKAPPLKALRTA